MSIVAWLKGLKGRRLDLDEEDFQDEIRAHLAIATDEGMDDPFLPISVRHRVLR